MHRQHMSRSEYICSYFPKACGVLSGVMGKPLGQRAHTKCSASDGPGMFAEREQVVSLELSVCGRDRG